MTYDVAIVGAGPSGSWTAKRLADRGARVVLIDPSHPREKSCGGGVTARALDLVSSAIPAGALNQVVVKHARFLDSTAGRSAIVPLDHEAHALVVASREHFDGLLLDAARQAGATLRTARVTALEQDGAGFHLDAAGETIRAAFVVGADGANSLVRRRQDAAFRRDQLSMATGWFAHGITSDEIVIELVRDPPGYIWSFPRPDHLAIGICAQADSGVQVSELRAMLARWIRATGLARGARLEPYSWPIPSLASDDFRTLPLAGDRWLTVGDAAGLVDPITREGIFFALQSASFAAEALSSSAPRPDRLYTDCVRGEIGAELERAARYKAGFFRPGFADLMVDALRASPKVRRVMADLVSGSQSYRDLKWRLLKTLELGLAWRWARSVA